MTTQTVAETNWQNVEGAPEELRKDSSTRLISVHLLCYRGGHSNRETYQSQMFQAVLFECGVPRNLKRVCRGS